MSVEGDPTSSTFYIDDLEPLYPAGDESKSQGDDHLRLIKKALKNTFGSVTAPVTASHTELNILDGVTASTAELNILDGVTSTAAELNKLDGVTVTTAEINTLAGIGSTAITTQLAAKQATITGAATTVDTENLTASRALISNSSGKIAVSAVTSTELALLSGASSLGGITQDSITALVSGTTSVKTFASTPKRITVLLSAVSTSGSSPLQLHLYNAAFTSTTYLGWHSLLTNSPAVAVANITSGIPIFPAGAAGNQISGTITFTQYESGSFVYLCEGSFFEEGSTTKICHVVGKLTASQAVDSIRITTINGTDTFDTGSWNVIYE